MKLHLVVVHEFGNYTKGDHITDEAEVIRVLSGKHELHVVKKPAPDTEVAKSGALD